MAEATIFGRNSVDAITNVVVGARLVLEREPTGRCGAWASISGSAGCAYGRRGASARASSIPA